MLRRMLALAAGTFVLAACGIPKPVAQPWLASPEFDAATRDVANPSNETGGTLRLVTTYYCGDWTPREAVTYACRNLQRAVVRQLTAFSTEPGSGGSTTVPDLAVAHGAADDSRTTWRYELRPGLRWSDGSPITAAQVAAGIESIGDSIPGVHVTEAQAGAEGAVVVRLAQPVGDLDAALALPQAAPVPPVPGLASGPFVVRSIGEPTVLERNTRWDEATDPVRRPKVDRIEVRVLDSVDDARAAVASGAADLLVEGGLDSDQAALIASDAQAAAQTDNPGTGRTVYLAVPGYGHAVWQQESCRQAVFSALDRKAVVAALAGADLPAELVAHPATTLSPPTIASFDWSYEPFAVGDRSGDLAAATAALESCPAPRAARLLVRDVPASAAVSEAVRASVARAGIDVEVVTVPAARWNALVASPSALRSAGADWVLVDRGADVPGVWGFWYPLVSGDLVGAEPSTNIAQVRLPAVDVLLDSHEIASTDRLMLDSVGRTIDRLVLTSGRYIPLAYAKTLRWRAPLSNVTTNGALGNQYDIVNAGLR